MPRASLDPIERDLRIQVMRAIRQQMLNRKMTPIDAAELLGVARTNVSWVVNLHAERVSLSQLLAWARKLGLDITIDIDVTAI